MMAKLGLMLVLDVQLAAFLLFNWLSDKMTSSGRFRQFAVCSFWHLEVLQNNNFQFNSQQWF